MRYFRLVGWAIITATLMISTILPGVASAQAVETEEPVSVEAFRKACAAFPGLQVKDNPAEQEYPMPLYTSNQNDCEIGRIRKDLYNDKGMNFWIVGDQIRKGAALNALQIAEYLVEKEAF